MLELNDVLLEGEPATLSLMAQNAQLTCIAGGTPERRTLLLLAMEGLAPINSGYVSIDGEPLESRSVEQLRQLMAYVPNGLRAEGEVTPLEPPTVQDVFMLKANRRLPISNGILTQEVRRMNADTDDLRLQLLAVAVLLGRDILLVDTPLPSTTDYLLQQAHSGRTVIVASDDETVKQAAQQVIIMSSGASLVSSE